MNRLPRRGRVAAPSVAAGVLLALSLPPWGWWPLGPVGAALLYWRLGGMTLRARLWSGWLAGLGCYGIGLFLARAFNWYGALVLILVEALFFAAAGALTPPHRGRAAAFVGACTLAEAVRMTWPFGGLPLGGVFLGQADGPLLELARLGGPLLITAGVWAAGVALATLAVWLGARYRNAARPSLAGVAVVVGGIVVLTVAGAVAPDGGGAVRTLRVAMVQGGGQRGLSKEQVSPITVYDVQVAATFPVTSVHPPPGLVLWPEDVVALSHPLAGSPEAAFLSRLAEELHTTLVVGVTEPAPSTTFRNEIVAWGPHGHVVGVSEKVHRVPSRSTCPVAAFLPSGRPLGRARCFPGHGSGLMRTPAGPLGRPVSSRSSTPAGAIVGASRGRTARRAHQHLLAPDVTGGIARDRRGEGAIGRDGRDPCRRHPRATAPGVTSHGVGVARSAAGNGRCRGRRGPAPWHDARRPLGGPARPDPLGARAGAGWARQVRGARGS